MATLDLAEINKLGFAEFTDKFANIIEHCPVIAAAVWSKRPFADLRSLENAFSDVIDELPTCGKWFL